ncbi:MAG TPA: cation diffusion facilitator family transporter [Acidimicrobiia bacterium]|jgi:cation diffusion facilitator family transporter|nr:cation diffusion facilitator family transporter [Acidimicrobiia bacterium]
MREGSKKAIVAAFLANLGIAIAKTVGFIFTRSAGLLAEAGHSMADTGNQALLLLGGRRAARKADREHPFGYGRERYFWAFVVALVLFSMGGLFALYEGIDKFRHPHETENLLVAIGILVVAIGLETFSLLTALREARHVKTEGTSWWEFLHHAKSPELPVVLLEDLGAEIGLVLALAGVLAAHVTHDPRWDAAGSMGIGVLLVIIAIFLAIEMKGLLIGESATGATEQAIVGAIESSPQVRGLIHLKTQHLGPDELLIGAKVDFNRDLDVRGLAAAVDEVEAAIRQAVPAARVIYLEPDLRRQAPE